MARSRQIAEELEVEAAASHQELLDNADLVILGINLKCLISTSRSQFPSTYHSMAAGVTLERLASLTSPDLPLIRIMPNLNDIKFSKATTGLCTNDKYPRILLAVAKEITDSFGTELL